MESPASRAVTTHLAGSRRSTARYSHTAVRRAAVAPRGTPQVLRAAAMLPGSAVAAAAAAAARAAAAAPAAETGAEAEVAAAPAGVGGVEGVGAPVDADEDEDCCCSGRSGSRRLSSADVSSETSRSACTPPRARVGGAPVQVGGSKLEGMTLQVAQAFCLIHSGPDSDVPALGAVSCKGLPKELGLKT